MNAPFKLTSRQDEALDVLGSDARHILLEGGSRSGKTFITLRVIALRALAAPGSRHAVFRLHFNSVKASVIYDTFPKMMQLCFPGVPYEINKSDWFATFPNKSQIWFGGLDDKERTEKILGQEYATIFLNEVSQIPFSSRNLALTRLAQLCTYEKNGVKHPLRLKTYYDCNPPSKAHWAYKLFHENKDPETNKPIDNFAEYAYIKLNPKDNTENLPAEYLKTLEALPLRLRKRFLEGSYAEVAPGALWTDEMIDQNRCDEAPDMVRVVVAVDPSGADDDENAGNDEIGILVAGLGTDGRAYVLEDCTVLAGPKTWGNLVAAAYDRHQGDLVVGETNYGGEMVKYVVQTAKPGIPFKKITASRGKCVRAEPISSLTEQGKIRFYGSFNELETELCAMTTTGYKGNRSPNRADAFVWAMSELFPGIVTERKKAKATANDFRPSISAYAA
ncbi:MAG: DNA-packaging protein [Hyphomicrobiaceae bacterium]|nr:MAG: DNA-packaging protein [Hyphomicrobiaceae bacterium]